MPLSFGEFKADKSGIGTAGGKSILLYLLLMLLSCSEALRSSGSKELTPGRLQNLHAALRLAAPTSLPINQPQERFLEPFT